MNVLTTSKETRLLEDSEGLKHVSFRKCETFFLSASNFSTCVNNVYDINIVQQLQHLSADILI